eukprot:TRINITY_DN2022_c0_g2_i1.p1 TRINITY_DN2022_c0_g2~~TRINITY_DN2022_c0_g2_i1.p1  ORF type:complete len:483 (+),score=99.44 TRINITY_DN2022_c0_g2_i1:971-2419(+)
MWNYLRRITIQVIDMKEDHQNFFRKFPQIIEALGEYVKPEKFKIIFSNSQVFVSSHYLLTKWIRRNIFKICSYLVTREFILNPHEFHLFPELPVWNKQLAMFRACGGTVGTPYVELCDCDDDSENSDGSDDCYRSHWRHMARLPGSSEPLSMRTAKLWGTENWPKTMSKMMVTGLRELRDSELIEMELEEARGHVPFMKSEWEGEATSSNERLRRFSRLADFDFRRKFCSSFGSFKIALDEVEKLLCRCTRKIFAINVMTFSNMNEKTGGWTSEKFHKASFALNVNPGVSYLVKQYNAFFSRIQSNGSPLHGIEMTLGKRSKVRYLLLHCYGFEEGLEKALKLIQETLVDYEIDTISIPLPSIHVGISLIGKKGSTLMELQKSLDCISLRVEKDDLLLKATTTKDKISETREQLTEVVKSHAKDVEKREEENRLKKEKASIEYEKKKKEIEKNQRLFERKKLEYERTKQAREEWKKEQRKDW